MLNLKFSFGHGHTLLVFSVVALCACSKFKPDKNSPSCLKEIIKSEYKNCPCERAYMAEYFYLGQNVYVFQGIADDYGANVYSDNCEKIGTLQGNDGMFPDSIWGEEFSKAEFTRRVWEND